jgi:hypothetical protein
MRDDEVPGTWISQEARLHLFPEPDGSLGSICNSIAAGPKERENPHPPGAAQLDQRAMQRGTPAEPWRALTQLPRRPTWAQPAVPTPRPENGAQEFGQPETEDGAVRDCDHIVHDSFLEDRPNLAILIFAKDTLPTIVELRQQPAHQVQRIIAKDLMSTLYVNSRK